MSESIRVPFVNRFGEEAAAAIEGAAEMHKNEPNGTNKGSDPFRWAIAICIGYECMEVDHYRKDHGIEPAWDELKDWIMREGDLANHDGDVDYLTLFAGGYSEFV